MLALKKISYTDRWEAQRVVKKYGEDAVDILKARAGDRKLSARSRRHWRRILRAVKRV